MTNFSELSQKNLEKIQKVLNILLEDLNLQGNISPYGNKTATELFNREGISTEEVKSILSRIQRKKGLIFIMSYDLVVEKTHEKIQEELDGSPDYDEQRQWYEKNFNTIISPEIFSQNIFLIAHNLKKLKDFKKEVDEKIKQLSLKDGKNSSRFIKEIICVKPIKDNDRFKIVVNDNYLNPIEVDKTRDRGSWDLLYRVAEEGEVYADKDYKNNLGYFNTNRRNKIYTKTKLNLTKVLKQEGDYIRPEDDLKIKSISHKAFMQKKNKTSLKVT